MREAWQILRDGGLPLAVASSGVTRTARELAVAMRAAIAEEPSGRDAEALAAYVFAWHQHWPACFATELGDDAGAVIEWATRNAIDDNRYLKLRRIALENLSRIL
ncbi:MAG: hypothetical protein ABI591_00220 [Kofleriaceae bacterium]